MALTDFIRRVKNFDQLSHPEKIKRFAWFLHTERKLERFEAAALRACYGEVQLPPPDFSVYLKRMSERKAGSPAPALLKDKVGYALSGPIRREFDKLYGDAESVIEVSQLLRDLPGKISDQAERVFLTEALKCYRHEAFRAAIVMTWNLAYDHLLNWLISDAARLAQFNQAIPKKYPKKAGTTIVAREDFEEFKEFEVIEICGTAGVFSSTNLKRILSEKLTRRNMAAHPSLVEFGRPQADDMIFDLVTNIVLKLT